MKKLSEFEKAMLKTISQYMPYSIKEVRRIYLIADSFDKTIYILYKSIQLGVSPDDLFFDWLN